MCYCLLVCCLLYKTGNGQKLYNPPPGKGGIISGSMPKSVGTIVEPYPAPFDRVDMSGAGQAVYPDQAVDYGRKGHGGIDYGMSPNGHGGGGGGGAGGGGGGGVIDYGIPREIHGGGGGGGIDYGALAAVVGLAE
ncbi:RNA-binding protein cabeza-like [Mya arenaria]|uniref:RNA-binding protein cabeza-like n=1 Tax=Mya arenaria TaxID=6604 RepID=UPI0022E8228E|nr:RNA-binding protein cabeza-like [Mya arenaria]